MEDDGRHKAMSFPANEALQGEYSRPKGMILSKQSLNKKISKRSVILKYVYSGKHLQGLDTDSTSSCFWSPHVFSRTRLQFKCLVMSFESFFRRRLGMTVRVLDLGLW